MTRVHMEETNPNFKYPMEEILKEESSLLNFFLFSFSFALLFAGFMINGNIILGMSILIVGLIVSYKELDAIKQCYFYADRIEVNYPYNQSKNEIILKQDIRLARYISVEKSAPNLVIYYVPGNFKNKRRKLKLRLDESFKYIYYSNNFKILKRIKNWEVKLIIEVLGPPEILTLNKS